MDAHNLAAYGNRPIPTSVLGHECIAPEGAEEMNSKGCHMGLKLENRRNLARGRLPIFETFESCSASEIRKPIESALLDLIQFVGRDILTHSVGAVVSEEHRAAAPIETDRVAHAPSNALNI